MGYDEKTADRVRQILSKRSDVVEKTMVGGLSFMVNGSMCCGVTGSSLMVRVGPEERERALAQRHVRKMEFAGRPLSGFVCVDPAGFRTKAALATWVQRGIDFVSALPAKKVAARNSQSIASRRSAKGARAEENHVITKKAKKPRKVGDPPVEADERFALVVDAFSKDRQVSRKKMFSSNNVLTVKGKIFAMLVRGALVVKLPKKRVDELVNSGAGENFDPGHGRLMKEWVAMGPGTASWVEFATEARRFVKESMA